MPHLHTLPMTWSLDMDASLQDKLNELPGYQEMRSTQEHKAQYWACMNIFAETLVGDL